MKMLVRAFLALPFLLCLYAVSASAQSAPVVLQMPPPAEDGSDYRPESVVAGGVAAGGSLKRYFDRGPFNTIAVGRYLDQEPARRLADHFQARGITAFVLKKTIEEKHLFVTSTVGDFYIVMLGLFGTPIDAEILGRRLKAEGALVDFQVLPVGDPGELTATNAQNLDLYSHAAKVTDKAREKAGSPLRADSPAASGKAFKKHVYGRYVGSYRDLLEAQEQARVLTSGGWAASVEKEARGGTLWYRVYLSPTDDHRDWKANPQTLAAAKRSAASQPGLIVLADMSGLKGDVNAITPNAKRTDASACAGFSEAGRLGACLSRTINYIPDTSYTAALVPIAHQPMTSWAEIPDRVKNWWNDESARPQKKALFGPAIFNRPEMEKAVAKLVADPKQASLALGLTEVASELSNIPGRKILLVFSEFQGPDKPDDVSAALGRLQSAFGSSLEVIFIYGDPSDAGYKLASTLASQAKSVRAWDGCRLLNDNEYFEQYIKTIFR